MAWLIVNEVRSKDKIWDRIFSQNWLGETENNKSILENSFSAARDQVENLLTSLFDINFEQATASSSESLDKKGPSESKPEQVLFNRPLSKPLTT